MTALARVATGTRNITISLACRLLALAARVHQAGVSASMAIWSSVSLSNSASEYGALRSLIGLSQEGSEPFQGLSSMLCKVPLPQSHVASTQTDRSYAASPHLTNVVAPDTHAA